LIERARSLGVADEQLVIDPGPDFAKTPGESVDVLRRLDRLRELERPLLLAVSRKYFIGAITGRPPLERLGGTLAALAAGLDHGAAILRVHDVAEVRAFLQVRAVLAGEAEVPRFDPADERLKWERPLS
ncbi:MAG: dihydropteroate synthase, partial [Thermoleophilaceae bacterium]|nr:dihydropteroate synthase [Thermoleophilaceae bacterium]